MNTAKEMQDFARLIQALDPWLDQLVVIGGWAHRLYRIHPLAQELDYPPLVTLDTDVAVPNRLPAGAANIAKRLREYDFNEDLLGDHQPPVTQYKLGSEDTGFYAEFLTPLTGSGYKRDGTPDTTVRVAGVSSQKLRYLDVLLEHPWIIELDKTVGFPLDKTSMVKIPNAATFLAQKLLIHELRERKHRAKDVLYIHDTIEVFGGSLDAIKSVWHEEAKPRLRANVRAKVERAAAVMFSEVTDSVREAAEISRSVGRYLRPDDTRALCDAGVKFIFL
jgi:hypothetical protein